MKYIIIVGCQVQQHVRMQEVVFGACLTPELLYNCDSCHGNLDWKAAHIYSSSEK